MTAPCPKPGIYEGIPDAEYRLWPATSPSDAKPALVSKLQYLHSRRCPREETDAMRLGTLCHAAVMEPDTMLRRFALWEGERRAGNEWKAFVQANRGKIIIKRDQLDIAEKIRDRCQSHPAIRAILKEVTHTEVSLRWDYQCTRSRYSLKCKGRPDLLTASRIPDVKTTANLDDDARARTIERLGYDVSAAAYQLGVHALTSEWRQPVLIWVCTEPPHDAIVRTLEDDWLNRGADRWIDAIEAIAVATNTNEYPGMDEHEGPEVMPPWLGGDINSLGLVGLAANNESEV